MLDRILYSPGHDDASGGYAVNVVTFAERSGIAGVYVFPSTLKFVRSDENVFCLVGASSLIVKRAPVVSVLDENMFW